MREEGQTCVNTCDKWLYVERHQQGYRMGPEYVTLFQTIYDDLNFTPLSYMVSWGKQSRLELPHNHLDPGLYSDSKGFHCFL